MDKRQPRNRWLYPDKKCKACGGMKAWQDLNSDDICVSCHLELLDEDKPEHSLLYIVSDGKEGE